MPVSPARAGPGARADAAPRVLPGPGGGALAHAGCRAGGGDRGRELERMVELLVRTPASPATTEHVTLAHESLARAWPRLRAGWRTTVTDGDPAPPRGERRCLARPGTARERAVPRRPAGPGAGVAGRQSDPRTGRGRLPRRSPWATGERSARCASRSDAMWPRTAGSGRCWGRLSSFSSSPRRRVCVLAQRERPPRARARRLRPGRGRRGGCTGPGHGRCAEVPAPGGRSRAAGPGSAGARHQALARYPELLRTSYLDVESGQLAVSPDGSRVVVHDMRAGCSSSMPRAWSCSRTPSWASARGVAGHAGGVQPRRCEIATASLPGDEAACAAAGRGDPRATDQQLGGWPRSEMRADGVAYSADGRRIAVTLTYAARLAHRRVPADRA